MQPGGTSDSKFIAKLYAPVPPRSTPILVPSLPALNPGTFAYFLGKLRPLGEGKMLFKPRSVLTRMSAHNGALWPKLRFYFVGGINRMRCIGTYVRCNLREETRNVFNERDRKAVNNLFGRPEFRGISSPSLTELWAYRRFSKGGPDFTEQGRRRRRVSQKADGIGSKGK